MSIYMSQKISNHINNKINKYTSEKIDLFFNHQAITWWKLVFKFNSLNTQLTQW